MRLFVFDIDGTLTDSVATHHKCFLKAFSDVGIAHVDTNWANYKHHTDSWIFGEVFRRNFERSPNKSEVDAFANALSRNVEQDLLEKSLREIPGAAACIRQLQGDGQNAYAFATGSFREAAIRKLHSIGIEFPLQLLVTADDFETRDEIVSHAIAAAQNYFDVSTFEPVISLGDGIWDFNTAQNLGLGFVGIEQNTLNGKLKGAGALEVISDLQEFSDYFGFPL